MALGGAGRAAFELAFTGDTRGLQNAFSHATRSVDDFGTKTETHRKGMLKFAGTMKAGVAGAVITVTAFLGASAKAAMANEKAQAKLETTLKAGGITWRAHSAQITDVIHKTSDLSGLTDTDLKGAFTNIVRVTGDHPGGLQQALKLTAVAADIARAKHMDVAKAGELVGKVAGGNTGILKRYGVVIDKGSTSTEALGALQKKFSGQAAAYGNTTAGAQDKFKAATERLQVEIGTKLIPILTKLITVALDVIDHTDDVGRAIGRVATDAVKYVKDLPRRMGDAITSSPGALLDAGKWIMGQIWEGFKAAPGAILDAAKWLKDKVVAAVKDAFGISSPSKVFEKLGQSMTAGLIKGLDPGPVASHIAGLGGAVGNADRASSSAPAVAGWFAGGADLITSGPTLFGAGEAGPEHVQVTPLNRMGGGSGVTIHIDRPVFTSPRQPAAFGRRLAWRLAIT